MLRELIRVLIGGARWARRERDGPVQGGPCRGRDDGSLCIKVLRHNPLRRFLWIAYPRRHSRGRTMRSHRGRVIGELIEGLIKGLVDEVTRRLTRKYRRRDRGWSYRMALGRERSHSPRQGKARCSLKADGWWRMDRGWRMLEEGWRLRMPETTMKLLHM